MRKDGHLGKKVCTKVPNINPNRHIIPTVLKLNLKPYHRDCSICSIGTVANCDWNIHRNITLKIVNNTEKNKKAMISIFIPSNNRCHRFITTYPL